MSTVVSPPQPHAEARGDARSFDQLPLSQILSVFGVDYVHLHPAAGGDLLVTREGWPFVQHLMPERWFVDRWYATNGQKLPGSTGQVYRVQSRPVAGQSIDMVVKFSRVGQEVPLEVATTFPDSLPPEALANARFNSPMEELGLVGELRRGVFGPRSVRLLSHRPLAIYEPPDRFELWQLGRTHTRFSAHQHLLAEDQQMADVALELDIRREYVVIYSWIKGENAEEALAAGRITADEMFNLTRRVIDELRAKGFRVLDNKPKHFILRQRRDEGTVLRRRRQIVYGLVDFELLERTPEYNHAFQAAQRARYWHLQNTRLEQPSDDLPAHLRHAPIFGVNYIFGHAPNNGRVWAVGGDAALFDYFLPDRWRRTPRLKLSLSNEVYRTRTRDNIHVVYRRSRVGERPHVDPFYAQGKFIRQHGYNSPFEEVAIAERLRLAGIPTIYPRAIYRTGHESVKAGYILDPQRYISHADLINPDGLEEPAMSPSHDYYTIWGYFRGLDPQKSYGGGGCGGFIDMEKAREDLLLAPADFLRLSQRTRQRLHAIGFTDDSIEDHEFLLRLDPAGKLVRDADGEVDLTWCMDALTAHEYALLGEDEYRRLIERTAERLAAIGCESLNLSGNHLLLPMSPDGKPKPDEHGEIQATLCNFELIRVKYVPAR